MAKKPFTSIISWLFLVAVLLAFCSIAARAVIKEVLIEGLGMDNALTQKAFPAGDGGGKVQVTGDDGSTDWSLTYPFQEQSATVQVSFLQNLENHVTEAETALTDYCKQMLPYYDTLVTQTSAMQEKIGWNITAYPEYNAIAQVTGDYYATVLEKQDMTENIRSVSLLQEYCESLGTGFLYVQAPYKICKYTDNVVGDFSNENADALVAGLEAEGVAHIDMREEIHNAGYDHHSLFFVTDSHWKPRTGLWATGIIAQRLNDLYSCDIPLTYFEQDQYTAQVYEDWFLGSQGKRLTLARANPEDIELLYPTYPTDLRFYAPALGVDLTGDFSVVYDMSHIETKNYMYLTPYSAYAHSDSAVVRYENHLAPNDTKILLIKDSFANVVAPFLSQGVAQLDLLDLRYFNGSVETYIAETQPDVVMVLYNPGNLKEIDWDTHLSTFDFR